MPGHVRGPLPDKIEYAPGEFAVRCGQCENSLEMAITGNCIGPICTRPKCHYGYVGVGVGPTHCRPGSVGKLAVLAARYHRGELLWHPADARQDSQESCPPREHAAGDGYFFDSMGLDDDDD